MRFCGRARSRPARGKFRKALRKTGEVPQHNAERPDTTPNNDETDTAPCLPFASRSIAMASAAIKSPETTQCLGTGLLSAQAVSGHRRASRKCDMCCNRSHKISDMCCNRSIKAMTKISSRRWKCRSHERAFLAAVSTPDTSGPLAFGLIGLKGAALPAQSCPMPSLKKAVVPSHSQPIGYSRPCSLL